MLEIHNNLGAPLLYQYYSDETREVIMTTQFLPNETSCCKCFKIMSEEEKHFAGLHCHSKCWMSYQEKSVKVNMKYLYKMIPKEATCKI